MPKLYGVTNAEDREKIATILFRYGYTVRLVKEISPTNKRVTHVLEYTKDDK